tara:strand:+ start:521 stop:694 length:174 start_codon:yes stop_codon:yes gene_type:complete
MTHQKELTNLRNPMEYCKKCGAVGGEHCRHSSGSKKELSLYQLQLLEAAYQQGFNND